jgi:hypothetical protein
LIATPLRLPIEQARRRMAPHFEASNKSWADFIENPSDFAILIDTDEVSRTRRLVKV